MLPMASHHGTLGSCALRRGESVPMHVPWLRCGCIVAGPHAAQKSPSVLVHTSTLRCRMRIQD